MAILRQVADGLQTLARDRAVDVRLSMPASPLLVLGDRDELLRVFENLVENALKYGASGKRIEVTLASGAAAGGAPEARIAVRDYGPGIAPEHLPRLTERFYRVDVGEPGARGHRPGARLGQAHPQPPWRPPDHRERARAGATFTAHRRRHCAGAGKLHR